jgi:hypothetical protein
VHCRGRCWHVFDTVPTAAPQVQAGGVVAFRHFSTVLACPAAWGGGCRGYYEVEVLEMGLYTQASPARSCPCARIAPARV